jgi:hypothetical protein
VLGKTEGTGVLLEVFGNTDPALLLLIVFVVDGNIEVLLLLELGNIEDVSGLGVNGDVFELKFVGLEKEDEAVLVLLVGNKEELPLLFEVKLEVLVLFKPGFGEIIEFDVLLLF